MTQSAHPEYTLPEYINGSNLIIEDAEGKICLVMSLRGKYELPGGGVELRERELADEAGERETMEECNIFASRQHYGFVGAFVQTIPHTQDASGRPLFGQVLLFQTNTYDASGMKPGEEATQVLFMSEADILNAVEAGQFAPFSSYLRMIGHHLNRKRAGNQPQYISARLSDRVTFVLAGKTIQV